MLLSHELESFVCANVTHKILTGIDIDRQLFWCIAFCLQNMIPKEAVNIIEKDSYRVPKANFCPLQSPGPHVPLDEVNALSLFELFLMMQWWSVFSSVLLLTQRVRRMRMKQQYKLFMRKKLIKAPFLVLSHRTRVRSYGGGYSVRGRSNDKEGMWIPWVPSPHQFGVAMHA